MRHLFLALACLLAVRAIDPWTEKFGDTPDLSFSGITTFAHLPHERCLDHPKTPLDIGLIGVPFDTAVTFRPGMSSLWLVRADTRCEVRAIWYP